MKSLSDDDLNDLWIGAFRYYCGRATIAVSSFCDSLIKNVDSMPGQAKAVIERDLLEAFESDDRDRENNRDYKTLGHDCDRAKWTEVLKVFSKN